MAAYFLASYFQKRLLRYALNRLDLLDDDALDLDNLGVKIGQRSVIELKNVALKVSKILEKIELPDSVHITRATIRVLRITIPADLHISGIEVEVEGVDIAAEFLESKPPAEKQQQSRWAGRAPSHKDVVNRPRIGSTIVHDPGGRRVQTTAAETTFSQIIPGPRDLAASFLETEPEQERHEIEAAFESRSLYLQQSQSQNVAASNSDLGMAEGFSLPTFVTNFFTGIADRLSLSVENINIDLSLALRSDASVPEPVELMLQVDGIRSSTTTEILQNGELVARRGLEVNGIAVYLCSDDDTLTQKSSMSSPYLGRSRSNISDWNPSLSKPDSSKRNLSSSHSSSSVSTTRSDQLLDDAFGNPSPPHELTAQDSRELQGSAAFRDGFQAATVASNSPKKTPSADDAVDDLMESKLFSHDEAESMFMSAMSHATSNDRRMPGAFDEPSASSRLASRSGIAVAHSNDSRTRSPAFERASTRGGTTGLSGATGLHEETVQAASTLLRSAKRLLGINNMSLKMPAIRVSNDQDAAEMTEAARPRQTSIRSSTASRGLSASMAQSHNRMASDQSVYGVPRDHKVSVDEQTSYNLGVGDIQLATDLPSCHTLIRSVALLSPILQTREKKEQNSNGPSAEMHLSAAIQSLTLKCYQTVPGSKHDENFVQASGFAFHVSEDSSALLELRLLRAQMQAATRGTGLDATLAVHRLGLYRDADQFVSFFEPSRLQESMAAPSILLEPDDIVIRCLENRIDLTTRPIHIVLDLPTVDDVLSRSGGLSSLLDLATSASTLKEPKSQAATRPQRRRSVHFEHDNAKTSVATSANTVLKLNVRVSAVILDVVGSESRLQIQTSAVKIVQRPGKLRTNVTSISIRGPILQSEPTDQILHLKLNDFQLLFLNSPDEEDLDRLLQLLAPSTDQQGHDDDIMVDTLLRQRRKGSVVRLSLQDISVSANGLTWVKNLNKLSEEISKLSTVTKYLPEDDRPGILVFGLIKNLNAALTLDKHFGQLMLRSKLLEGALISVPSLMAAQVSGITLSRGERETILRELITDAFEAVITESPMVMCRFIPDEMEPTVKLKLSNTCLEYSVPLFMTLSQLAESFTSTDTVETNSPQKGSQISSATSEASELGRNIRLSLVLSSSAVSLKPLGSPACGLLLFSDAELVYGSKHNKLTVHVDIRKASVMLIDDASRLGINEVELDARLYFDRSEQVQALIKSGFVPVGSISAASADVKIVTDRGLDQQFVDVEFRNSLLFLETCADSTQTLIQVLSKLTPPAPPSTAEKFRTEVVPIQDMLASWTGDAFVAEKGPELGMRFEEADATPTPSRLLEAGLQHDLPLSASHHTARSTTIYDSDRGDEDDNDYLNDLYVSGTQDLDEDAMARSSVMTQSVHSSFEDDSVHIAPVNISADDEPAGTSSIMVNSLIDWRAGHFVPEDSSGGTAHRWDAQHNTYDMSNESVVQHSPLKVRVRDLHIIWNLLDGYDWQNTRDTIAKAVREVEDKAYARQRRRDSHRSPGPEEEEESVIGDVLFNSIYISIPTNRDPSHLANAINMEIGDAASETGSYATSTTITAITSKRQSAYRPKHKKLKLNRSKTHKITFELEGLAVDFFAFPARSTGVESSVDIRVHNLVVYDHVPTSTWKKFATYDFESGEREVGTDMVHIELLNVKPVAELASSEIVLKLTVLPLRLHVDQDALDFMTRFFEFKDDRISPSGSPSNPPFIQRAEVNPIKLKLDFKPKRVDYAGLKSGKLTEFMNFIILERSDMVLRRVILYGVSGFDRLGIMLNNIWTPDVRNNQLPGVLAGLAPVRSLVDVGAGVRDLIAVPIREYRKDGRIVRSIQKGAIAFAKTTTTELVNLGAKLAIGTQTILQNAEGALSPQSQRQSGHASDSEEEEHQISHYAGQPLGVVQGLRGAYASLERDLLLAKDAIIAVPGEIMAEGSAVGAAKVVLKQSPTIILRPAIGVTTAVGQALLGAGNTLDKGKRRRLEDVSVHSIHVLMPMLMLHTEIQEVLNLLKSIP